MVALYDESLPANTQALYRQHNIAKMEAQNLDASACFTPFGGWRGAHRATKCASRIIARNTDRGYRGRGEGGGKSMPSWPSNSQGFPTQII